MRARRSFLTGQRLGLPAALMAGALGALALEPYALWPFLFVTLSAPVLLLDRLYRRRNDLTRRQLIVRGGLIGWVWGFGYFTMGLWWLGKAFLVDPQFVWLMPVGVAGLPAALALFPGCAFAMAIATWSEGLRRIVLFAALLTLSEWLRGHLFSGFPWNVIGMMLGNDIHMMQAASLIGLYGLTLIACLIGAAPAAFVNGRRGSPITLAALLFAGIAAYGFWRVPDAPQPTRVDVRLRIVQPNVPEDGNFTPENGTAILDGYIRQSITTPAGMSTSSEPPTHYIWPESAFPFILGRDKDALARIGQMLSPTNAVLITGAARMGAPLPGEEVGTFYNSIQTIDAEGIIRDSYDKVHLVPFGEYVPDFAKAILRSVGLRQFISYLPGGFTPGMGRRPLLVRGLPPSAPNICYEAIFPGDIATEGETRPSLILNVTNDAWFGDSPGPRQHFAQARLRAVEQGLPLVRAANSGISGVIDPYGRVLARTGLNERATLDSELPFPLDAPTLYSRFGDQPFAFLLMLALALGLPWRRRVAENA